MESGGKGGVNSGHGFSRINVEIFFCFVQAHSAIMLQKTKGHDLRPCPDSSDPAQIRGQLFSLELRPEMPEAFANAMGGEASAVPWLQSGGFVRESRQTTGLLLPECVLSRLPGRSASK